MKKEEKASISIMKIICIAIILVLISGIGVMAVNTNLNDVKIVLQNGYEMTALTLHEIGHMIEGNSIPYRLSNTVQVALANSKKGYLLPCNI